MQWAQMNQPGIFSKTTIETIVIQCYPGLIYRSYHELCTENKKPILVEACLEIWKTNDLGHLGSGDDWPARREVQVVEAKLEVLVSVNIVHS